MKLYIMRHGPAEDAAASRRDFDRALTASGRDRVRDVARILLAENEAPGAIFTSPLVRALQTAEIVATVTKLTERGGTLETHGDLAAGSSAETLVRSLVTAGRERVMLVGHEPDLATLVTELSGHVVGLGLQKAMVVGLEARASQAKGTRVMGLRFVLDPRALVLDPDARSS